MSCFARYSMSPLRPQSICDKHCRMIKHGKYTCNEYRQEMVLLGLKNRLSSENLSDEEKQNLVEEIKKLEAVMCMD